MYAFMHVLAHTVDSLWSEPLCPSLLSWVPV